jgi:ATP synthase subunit C.
MKRKILFVCILLIGMAAFAQESSATASAAGAETSAAEASNAAVFKYFAAALAVGISCIAGGIAVARIGSAAMGAMSENADLSGKALPYAGLAEGICLWGFLVALLILFL